MSFFSKNIRFLRCRAQLSQTAFAKILGLTRSTVGAYEEERAEPKLDMILRMARHFGIQIEDLIGKDLQEQPDSGSCKAILDGIPYIPEDQIQLLSAPDYVSSASLPKVRIPGMGAPGMVAVEYCGQILLAKEFDGIIAGNGIGPERILVIRESGASILSATSGYDFRRAYEILYIIKRYQTSDYVSLMLGDISRKIDALATGKQ